MKSKTSFSKLTVFKKDLTRFAPVWALYLIGMILVLFEETSYIYSYDRFARNVMPSMIMAFGVVNVIYAGVCAVLLFGDLYNTRMCYSLHTQPARRESLFLSHIAAGLCMSLVPNLVAALWLMSQLDGYWFLALYWLLAVTLQFVFFYGVAALSVMFTGNRFAMLLVYAGLNFVSMLAYWIVSTIYLPQITGVVLDLEGFSKLCPVVQMFSGEYFAFKPVEMTVPYGSKWDSYTFYQYVGLDSGWGYLAVLGVLGLVLMGLALLLYKARHLESAGDFVAFPKLKGTACVIMTVCVAGVFAFVGKEMIGDDYILWTFVGLVVGYFGSLMLLERQVKVFRVKTFIGLGTLAAVLVGSFLMIAADVFNIEGWTPKASQVKSVTVANYRRSSGLYYDYDYYYSNRIAVEVTDTEEIDRIIEAHQDILDRLDEDWGDQHRVVLTYQMKDGRTVVRSYWAPASGTNYEILADYFYSTQAILGYNDWDTYVHNVTYLSMDGMNIPSSCYEEVLEALRTDCEKGYVTTDGKGTLAFWMSLRSSDGNGTVISRELAVQTGAVNTIEVMKKPEIILGYSDWTQCKASYMCIIDEDSKYGTSLPEKEYSGLLEALYLDAQNGNIDLDAASALYYVELQTESDWRYLPITKYAVNTVAWIENYQKSAN